MAAVTKTFSDAGVSGGLFVRKGESLVYSVDYSSDFDGGLFLERTRDGGLSYDIIRTFAVGYKTDVSATTIFNEGPDAAYRFRCIIDPAADPAALTGTAAITLNQVAANTKKRIINAAGQAKAGATTGFVVAVADNVALVTCPASKTAATLVIPIPQLKEGDVINGFHLVGQIESAGGTVTVDADLRVQTAAAADVVDASVGAITQLSVIADTVMSASNTEKKFLNQVVGANESYYVLVTATTAASTDIALQAVALNVTEA